MIAVAISAARHPGMRVWTLVDERSAGFFALGMARALRAPVAAVSVGVLGGQTLLDLDYDEDSAAEVDMNVVGNAAGELLEVQGTAEKRPFTPAQLGRLLEVARGGVRELSRVQREALRAAGVALPPRT